MVRLKDGIQSGLVYVAADIRLQVKQDFSQRQDFIFLEILENRIEDEDFAVDVHLLGDVNTLEEVHAKAVEVFESSGFLGATVPEDALKPLNLCFEEGDVAIGLSDVSSIVLNLPHHLHEDLYAFSLNHLLPDRLQDNIGLAWVVSHKAKTLILTADLLQQLVPNLSQNHSRPQSHHLDLGGLVDFIFRLFGTESVLDLVEKS